MTAHHGSGGRGRLDLSPILSSSWGLPKPRKVKSCVFSFFLLKGSSSFHLSSSLAERCSLWPSPHSHKVAVIAPDIGASYGHNQLLFLPVTAMRNDAFLDAPEGPTGFGRCLCSVCKGGQPGGPYGARPCTRRLWFQHDSFRVSPARLPWPAGLLWADTDSRLPCVLSALALEFLSWPLLHSEVLTDTDEPFPSGFSWEEPLEARGRGEGAPPLPPTARCWVMCVCPGGSKHPSVVTALTDILEPSLWPHLSAGPSLHSLGLPEVCSPPDSPHTLSASRFPWQCPCPHPNSACRRDAVTAIPDRGLCL